MEVLKNRRLIAVSPKPASLKIGRIIKKTLVVITLTQKF